MSCYKYDYALQAIMDEHSVEAAQQQAAQPPQPVGSSPPSRLDPPASQQALSQSQSSPPPASSAAAANLAPVATPTTTAAAAVAAAAATPAAGTPAATPVPGSLLRATQAANLLTGSPLGATPASRAQTSSSGRQAGPAEDVERPPAAAGMHAPSQATQNTEVTCKQLMHVAQVQVSLESRQLLMHSAVGPVRGECWGAGIAELHSSTLGCDAGTADWC